MINTTKEQTEIPRNSFKKFKGVCISAGGSNGIYYLGILDYYFNNNMMDEITHYSGTSIGSMICLLLIIGYSPVEIFVETCKEEFNLIFKEFNLSNLMISYGLIDTSPLKKYLEEMIILKMGYVPTMKNLFETFNKLFYCSSYNLTDKKNRHTCFSYETHPYMNVIDAVMCSSSIPFIFSKTIFENNIYIDGAVSMSTPINILLPYFENEDYKLILCINYKRKDEGISSLNFLSYIYKIMDILFDSHLTENIHLVEYDCIESSFNPFKLSLETKTKIDMFSEGKQFIKKKYNNKEKLD